MWLPILDITGELEALDITAELELLDLDMHRAEFDATLRAHETDFWSRAPLGLEAAIARVTFVEPAEVEDPPVPAAPAALTAPEAPAAPSPAPQPEPEPAARLTHALHSLTGAELRNRLLGMFLVLALIGAFATILPSVVGASPPQRYVTISIDGRTVSRTVRATTVADVLALENITVREDDRVVPAASTELREDMHIAVLRSFPVDVDVNGEIATIRTTVLTRGALRRELGIDDALLARGPEKLAAGTTVAFRTPHAVTLQVDGRTINAPRTAALDVAALLREQGVPLGARDEVMPAPSTRLSDGMRVNVYRLADDQVADRVTVPFTTEVPRRPEPAGRPEQDDPSGGSGRPARHLQGDDARRRFRGVTDPDRVRAAHPARLAGDRQGHAAHPSPATGSATWYGTGPGPGTCAHLSLPFGTVVTLTNRDTGAVAQCRVQDRGPETWTGHIIDLAPDVFRRLAPLSQGIVPNIALSW